MIPVHWLSYDGHKWSFFLPANQSTATADRQVYLLVHSAEVDLFIVWLLSNRNVHALFPAEPAKLRSIYGHQLDASFCNNRVSYWIDWCWLVLVENVYYFFFLLLQTVCYNCISSVQNRYLTNLHVVYFPCPWGELQVANP